MTKPTKPKSGFTVVWLDRGAKPQAKSYVVYDAKQTGLGIKVRPSGKMIWVFQTVYPGSPSGTPARRNLGFYPAMPLAEARRKASEWHSLVRQGDDPTKLEKQQAAERARLAKAQQDEEAKTFAWVAERYIKERLDGQRRAQASAREVRNILVTAFGDKPIASITPQDIKDLIRTIKPRAPFQARTAYGHLSALCKWCIHNDLLAVSPMASLSKKLVLDGAELGPRQRVLNNDEIMAFWRASGKLTYPYQQIYRLLLLTACRHGEISKARWSELHPELRKALRAPERNWAALPATARVLTIPAERFKSKTPHAVPLTDDALEVLATIPWVGGEFMFSADLGEHPIQMASDAKARIDKLMLRTLRALARQRGEDPDTVRLEPFVIHDLRRVVRTNLAALGIEDHVSEMVLGHGRKGLQRVYDQHRYEPQQRQALERWAARLWEIVAPEPPAPPPENVIKLRKKKVSA